MYSNLHTKQEILEDFNLFLLDKYGWMGFNQIDKMMSKANEILQDGAEYDYRGHWNLYKEIVG